MRRLIITYRDVLPHRRTEHQTRWRALRDAVVRAGGHAWLFRAESDENLFVEFVEYRDPALLNVSDVSEARLALDEALPDFERTGWLPAD